MRTFSALCLVAMTLLAACNQSDKKMADRQTMRLSSDLAERVQKIASRVGDLSTTPNVLLQDRAFREVFEAPDNFAEEAAALYADPKQSLLNKEITGYAMQRLPLAKLVWLVSVVTDLVAKNAVPGKLLDQLAFPSFDWGTQLRENYEQREVRALLERIAGLEQLSEKRRDYIRERVLTGKAREEILELREAGQIP